MVQELLQEHSFNNCLLSSEDVLVAKSLQLCPTLCYPIDGSPPGSAIPGDAKQGTYPQPTIHTVNKTGSWLLIIKYRRRGHRDWSW